MKNYQTREDWGARDPAYQVGRLPGNVGICLHHGGTGHPSNERQAESLVRGYQNYHMDNHGWADIAYNFLVDSWGNIYEGRGWYTRSAAQGTSFGNDNYLAICVVGHTDRGSLSSAAKNALRELRSEALSRGFGDEILPHSTFTGTFCPGNKGRSFVYNGDWTTQEEESWLEMASKEDVRDVVQEEIRKERKNLVRAVWAYSRGGGERDMASLNASGGLRYDELDNPHEYDHASLEVEIRELIENLLMEVG